jgi:hypothetical protein
MHCYFGNHINIKKTQNTKKNYKSWKNYIYIYISVGNFQRLVAKDQNIQS